jgi:Icc-related predicted phosphoesterase
MGHIMNKLKILAFSDYRVQNIELVIDFLQKMKNKPDLILYGGDDVDRFVEYKRDPKTGKRGKIIRNYFEEIATYSKLGLCAVNGNDDFPKNKYIIGKNVNNVQDSLFSFKNYIVIGIEGYVENIYDKGIGYHKFNENTLKKYLETIKQNNKNKKMIILSHSPPKNTLDLAIRFGQRSIGSTSLKSFIEKNHKTIPLVVCGHVHLHGGKQENIKNTVVVNAASHDDVGASGKIGLIDIENNDVKISWTILDEGMKIHGIGPKKYNQLKKEGITSIADISKTSIKQLSSIFPKKFSIKLKKQAQSHLENKIIILEPVRPIEKNPLFLDIETDLKQELVWMIGIYNTQKNKIIQFVAHKPSEERKMLKQFLEYIKLFKGKIYIFSATRFDENVIKKRMEYHKIKHSSLPKFVDLAFDIIQCYALPLKSYRLKSISDYFQYTSQHPDVSGIEIALQYLTTYQETRNKKLMKKFLEYNEDDLRSLKWIMDKLSSIK